MKDTKTDSNGLKFVVSSSAIQKELAEINLQFSGFEKVVKRLTSVQKKIGSTYLQKEYELSSSRVQQQSIAEILFKAIEVLQIGYEDVDIQHRLMENICLNLIEPYNQYRQIKPYVTSYPSALNADQSVDKKPLNENDHNIHSVEDLFRVRCTLEKPNLDVALDLTSCSAFHKHVLELAEQSERTRERFQIGIVSLRLNLLKIVKELNTLYTSLEEDKSLPKPDISSTNFLKNNKIPSPDDEDSKRKKLPISIAQELANRLDLTDKEMANILTISIRTYHRLKLNGLLNPVASERLMLLKDLAEYGFEVFEDQNNFNKWLRLPTPELSNFSPLDSLDTATGFNHVKTVLERIEYGVYS